MADNQGIKRFYTVKEFYEEIGHVVTLTQLYRMVKAGEIPTKRIGSKYLILGSWVRDFLDEDVASVQKA